MLFIPVKSTDDGSREDSFLPDPLMPVSAAGNPWRSPAAPMNTDQAKTRCTKAFFSVVIIQFSVFVGVLLSPVMHGNEQ